MKMDKNYEVVNLKDNAPADYQIKVVFLGNAGVGKTSIIEYEVEDKFIQNIQSTSVFQYFSKNYQICEKNIHLQMWDMGGDNTYEKVMTNFYTAALCFFFVFSFDDKNSFYDLDKWINNIKNEYYQSELPFLILIGNKKDLISNEKIPKEEIEDFVEKNNFDLYYETSAKSGESIHDLFEDIIKKLYIKFIEPNISDSYSTKSSQSAKNSLNACGIDNDKCKVCDCFIF